MRKLKIDISEFVTLKGNRLTIPKLTSPLLSKLSKRQQLNTDRRLFSSYSTGELLDRLKRGGMHATFSLNLKSVTVGGRVQIGYIHDSPPVEITHVGKQVLKQGKFKFTLEFLSETRDKWVCELTPHNFKDPELEVVYGIASPYLKSLVVANSVVKEVKLHVHTFKKDGTFEFNSVPEDLNVPALVRLNPTINYMEKCDLERNEETTDHDNFSFLSSSHEENYVMDVVQVVENPTSMNLLHDGRDVPVVNNYRLWFVCPLHTSIGCSEATMIVDEDNNLVDLHVGHSKEYSAVLNAIKAKEEAESKRTVFEFMEEYNSFKRGDANVIYAKRWFYCFKKLLESDITNVYEEARILAASALKEQYGIDKLFCMYKGEQWRVNGYSRLGDIYLTKSMNVGNLGYTHRVAVDDVSDWSSQKDDLKFSIKLKD